MQTETEKFDQWALVEIMGHRKLAGRVTEQTIGGAALLRVDVPETSRQPAFTSFVGGSAIFSLTPVTEAIARAQAERFQAAPVSVYDLPRQLLTRPTANYTN